MRELTKDKLTVEIWSDVACPFCYIGKRNFEAALANFSEKDQVEVIWKSFILDPSLPESSDLDLFESLSQRKGLSMEQVMQMTAQVKATAARAGITMDFENAIPVNTFRAHRVLQRAKEMGKGAEMKDRLLKAYFTEGANVSDAKLLIKLASEVGISAADVELALSEEHYATAVQGDVQEARGYGIGGVPYFVVDRKYGISGAQPTATFEQALSQAYAEWAKMAAPLIETRTDGAACKPSGECD